MTTKKQTPKVVPYLVEKQPNGDRLVYVHCPYCQTKHRHGWPRGAHLCREGNPSWVSKGCVIDRHASNFRALEAAVRTRGQHSGIVQPATNRLPVSVPRGGRYLDSLGRVPDDREVHADLEQPDRRFWEPRSWEGSLPRHAHAMGCVASGANLGPAMRG